MTFNPHPTYAGLLKQARAMAMLLSSKEGELASLRVKDYSQSERVIKALRAQVESEKAMNDQLTRELMSLEPAR